MEEMLLKRSGVFLQRLKLGTKTTDFKSVGAKQASVQNVR